MTQPTLNRDGMENIFVHHTKKYSFKYKLLWRVIEDTKIIVLHSNFISNFHLEIGDHAQQEESLMMLANGILMHHQNKKCRSLLT
jgi:hypothetical protein